MSDVNYSNGSVQNKVLAAVDYQDEPSTAPVEKKGDPIYLPAKGMSIPVPKSYGKLIQKQYEDAKKAIEGEHTKWDMQFKLYRQCGREEGLDDNFRYDDHSENEADENIIRTNVKSIMRSTYMQNPHVEFTDVTVDKLADSLEYILDFMMNKRAYPGLNMKPKARRWILHGQLTNFGCMRLDFVDKAGSRQEAVDELRKLEAQLEKAKGQKQVEQIYAKLERMHQALPLAQNKGMMVSNVLPHHVIVDPKCTLLDLSDADWLDEEFDMDRIYMQQVYYTKDKDGVLRMRSNPNATTQELESHDVADVKQHVVDIVMNERSQEQKDLLSKDTVRCVYHYDKILRRIALFNTEDWCYPLWVEEDTMLLSRFFRHFFIAFGEPIDGIIQPGESSFYVGQVNEINRINRKASNVRNVAFNTLVYNKKGVDVKEVQKLIRHMRNPKAVSGFGIANDSDKKINELLEALIPPVMQFKDLFDTNGLRGAINRAANVQDVEQGQQFKTNTTNEAIGQYAQQRQETTGVLVDIIEDAFSDMAWAMSELLVSKYSKEEVVQIVGPKKAEGFVPMSVEEFNQTYRMELASGSIEKPTTEFKKKEALNVAQAVGQVGQAAPGTSLMIMLKMFEKAFSGLVVTKDDWAMLSQEATANLQKGVSTNGTTPPPATEQPAVGPVGP